MFLTRIVISLIDFKKQKTISSVAFIALDYGLNSAWLCSADIAHCINFIKNDCFLEVQSFPVAYIRSYREVLIFSIFTTFVKKFRNK